MKKILIVFGSRSGCTEEMAHRVAQVFIQRGAEAQVVAAKHAPSPEAFDGIIVGSGIRAGQWHKPVRTWIAQHADSIRPKPLACFTCGLTPISQPDKLQDMRAISEGIFLPLGLKPMDTGLFAGWFLPDRFAFAERSILKLLKAPQGDHRDWAALEAWSGDIAQRLLSD